MLKYRSDLVCDGQVGGYKEKKVNAEIHNFSLVIRCVKYISLPSEN